MWTEDMIFIMYRLIFSWGIPIQVPIRGSFKKEILKVKHYWMYLNTYHFKNIKYKVLTLLKHKYYWNIISITCHYFLKYCIILKMPESYNEWIIYLWKEKCQVIVKISVYKYTWNSQLFHIYNKKITVGSSTS